jgi:hypothetical protein
MTYHGYSDTVENLTIGANNSGNPRIDAVVAYVDLSASPNSDASNVLKFTVVAGTPASSPVVPSDSEIQAAIGAGNPFIRLAEVLVNNGASIILNSNITDKRISPTIFLPEVIIGGSSKVDNIQEKTTNSGVNIDGVELKDSQVYSDQINEKTTNSGVNIDGLQIKDNQVPLPTPLYTATDGATITFDLAVSRNQIVTLGGNRTLAVSNAQTGMVFMIHLKQDATGGRTVNFWSGIQWQDGTTPILTTTANKIDTFGFVCIGTNQYLGFIVGQNL